MKTTSAILWGIQTLALATSLAASTAWADTTTTTNLTATTEKPSALADFLSKVSVNYVGYFNGPAVNGLDQDNNPQYSTNNNALGAKGLTNNSTMNLDSFVGVTYKINPNLVVGVTDEIQAYAEPSFDGSATTVYSPYVRLNVPHLYQNGGFNINSDVLRAYIPVGIDMTSVNMVGYFRSQYNMSYDIPKTRLTLGALPTFRWYIFNGPVPAGTYDFRTTFSAYANYQISEKVAATLWSDIINAKNYAGTGFDLANMSGYEDAADIQPGISIDITKRINVNPYISIIPASVSLSTTSLNMIVSAKIF